MSPITQHNQLITRETERGLIWVIQVVWHFPERRGKGSEERRREIRWRGVKIWRWE